MNDNPGNIAQFQTDKEWADDFRKRLETAIHPVLELLSEAKARGIAVNLNMGPTYGTRIGLTGLTMFKEL